MGPPALLVMRLLLSATALPFIGEIDFPMPGKLKVTLAAREVVNGAPDSAASNSTGVR